MGIIKDIWNKCKTDWFLGLVFALGLVLAFGLGRLVAFEASRTSVTITYPNPSDPNVEPNYLTLTNEDITGDIVASKQGSKYHLSSCPGAKQIKPENRVVFPSAAAAAAAGYEPAANCPGLK